MLQVKAKAGVSAIHGLGLIALEDIPAGTLIWEFTPGIDKMMLMSEIEAMPEPIRSELLYYSCEQIVDPSAPSSKTKGNGLLCVTVGDIRFTNHSDSPNTYEVPVANILTRTYALRNIAKGEEITTDYRKIDARCARQLPWVEAA